MNPKLATRIAVAVLVLGALVGCSGDSDDDAGSADATESPSETETSADGDGAGFCDSYTMLSGDISTTDSVPAFEQLVATAPAKLRDDAEVAQNSALTYIDAVTAAGFDASVLDDSSDLTKAEDATLTAAIQGAGVDAAAYEKATGTIDTWAADNC